MVERTQVPYEKQESDHTCGAAALCMVCRAFGADCTQADVWDKVSKARYGGKRARTYLLAADAIARGFSALVIKAADPWKILQRCHDHDVLAIINHRMTANKAAGHYSVVIAVGDDHVLLHDPQRGPDQRLSREELLELWQPQFIRSEITGHVMVAVARTELPALPCPQNHEPVPESLPCRRCDKPIKLQPAAILGCMTDKCPERTWSRLYCPFCDDVLTKDVRGLFGPFG